LGKTIDIPIDDLVPHARPMLLLDEILEADEKHCLCAVTIRADSMFLGERGVPAYIGLEYMAQTVAAHGGYHSHTNREPVRTGFLLGTPRLETGCAHFPLGSVLEVSAEAAFRDEELIRFTCGIRDRQHGKQLQTAAISIFEPRDLDRYLGGAS